MKIDIAPEASSILGALRGIGYDLKIALADLVDNSIFALNNCNKTYKFIEICNNDISFDNSTLQWISIVDNGIGMNESDLVNAFKLGGLGVDKHRNFNDLGRFGLGLKTASFSQCRNLIVISKKVQSDICAFEFDLEAIRNSQKWEVDSLTLEYRDYLIAEVSKKLENHNILEEESWTIVVWQNFDKLQFINKRSFYNEIEKVRKHFSLVFHKFHTEIEIIINKTKIEFWDPFSIGTSDQKKEIRLSPNSDEKFTIRGHLLKHRSEFRNDADYEAQSKVGTFLKNQGLFIYRNKRLIVNGDWRDLFNLEPHYNFARIEIELSNSNISDNVWDVDISKSSVKIPEYSKQEIFSECSSIRSRAHDIYRYHGGLIQHKVGKSKNSKPISPLWICEKIGNNLGDKDVFKINKDHFVFKEIESKLDPNLSSEFNFLIQLLEKTLPIDSIFARKSNNELVQNSFDQDELFNNFIHLLKSNLLLGADYYVAFEYFKSFEPYNKIIFNDKMNEELLKLQ